MLFPLLLLALLLLLELLLAMFEDFLEGIAGVGLVIDGLAWLVGRLAGLLTLLPVGTGRVRFCGAITRLCAFALLVRFALA